MSTPQTGAPEWEANQGSPWLQANKARRIFDGFALRTSVADRDLAIPPVSCDDGARYLIDTGASGAWLGHDGEMAIAFGEDASNGWVFAIVANEGVQIWVEDEQTQIEFVAGNWVVSPERIVRINDLNDVDTTGLNDGDQLHWDASNGQWYAAPGAVGATALSALSDVDVSGGIADGYVLKFDLSNGKWFPSADENTGTGGGGGGGGATAYSALSDVSVAGLADGAVMKWDASNGIWYPSTDQTGAGGATALSGLSDVDLSGGIADGYVLKYDLSNGAWYPSADQAGSSGGGTSGFPSSAPTIRSSSNASGTGATLTITLPSGATAGDDCLLWVGGGDNFSSLTQTGWEVLGWENGTGQTGLLLYKRLTSGDIATGSVQANWAGAYQNEMVAVCFNGPTGGVEMLEPMKVFEATVWQRFSNTVWRAPPFPTTGYMVLCGAATRGNGAYVYATNGTILQNPNAANGSLSIVQFAPATAGFTMTMQLNVGPIYATIVSRVRVYGL